MSAYGSVHSAIADGQPVEVYWNFHRKLFSVRCNGRVVGHAAIAWLEDVAFKVSEAGRQRVLREKRKNVHAVLRGKWIDYSRYLPLLDATVVSAEVSYNPYKGPKFVDQIGRPIAHGSYVRLDARSPVKIEDRVKFPGA